MKDRTHNELARRPDGSFALPDLYGSAFLAAKGYKLRGVEFLGPNGRMAFVFEPSDSLDRDYLSFINDTPIGAQQFVGALYRLKRLLREAER